MELKQLAARQRAFFESGATRPLAFREKALRDLRAAVLAREADIAAALMADLHKHPSESYMCETGLVLDEIGYHLKHLAKWMRPQRVRTPLAQFPGQSLRVPEPHGRVLILSPWNYPLLLTLSPLIGAISGGNCAVVKPSAYAPATSALVAQLLRDTFPEEYIAVVEGGRAENQALLGEKFDYIFFTGSPAVGRQVMECAARHLTPVTLELGGKSPVIVDKSADVALAAKRIAFGKVLNGGQTCVAPDYLLVHASVKEEFVSAYARALEEFFPGGDLKQLPHIINDKHYRRLCALLEGQTVLLGGACDDALRRISPTLLDEPALDSPVMEEEIFGPILPVISFDALDECISFIRSRPKPLALYLFTRDKGVEERVFHTCSFGGGCVNDVVVHLATPHMPFGGVGESGMGCYHGKASFDAFSHHRSILRKANWLDLPMRYHPYTPARLGIIKKFLK